MNNTRKEYIDIYRGIGILCMVIGHIYIGFIFDKFSHAFHMPMFFFVTGYFFTLKNEKDFFWGKVKTLLVPYCIFGIINILIYSIIQNVDCITMLKHLFWVNTEGLYDVGAVWFLTSLFWASMIYFLLRKMIKNKILLLLLVVMVSVLGNVMSIFGGYRLPWSLDAAFVAVGFIYIGNIVRENEENEIIRALLNVKPIFLIILIVIDLGLIFINGYINMRTGEYSNVVLFWLAACVSIVVLWNLAKMLCHSRYRIVNGGSKCLQYIGRNSIVFLCLNQIIICALGEVLPNFNMYIKKAIVFAITIPCLVLINEAITRTKLKVIIGK